MRKVFTIISVLVLFVFLFLSCSKSNSGNVVGGGGGATLDCSGVAKIFGTDVNPIIQNFCNVAGCHTSGSSNGPGPLTNYTQVFNSRASIRDAVASGVMPQNTTLSITQKNAILCWIDSGAPNN